MQRMTRFTIAFVILAFASSASAQTIRESIARAATEAAQQTPGRSEYNKPLLYTGSALFGAGIGLVIGGVIYASDCDDYGSSLLGELLEDECRDAATRRYLYGAAFASGGTALMLLSRPRVARAMPSISFGRGRTTVAKTITF